MTQILIPNQHQAAARPFGELANRPGDQERVARAFVNTLSGAYLHDVRTRGKDFADRMNTQTERQRRADIMAKWFRRLRGDLGFSLTRALDEVPRALRAELDGAEYKPPERIRIWTPGGTGTC